MAPGFGTEAERGKNPNEVFAWGYDFATGDAYLAGYLHMKDTDELRAFHSSEPAATIFRELEELKKKGLLKGRDPHLKTVFPKISEPIFEQWYRQVELRLADIVGNFEKEDVRVAALLVTCARLVQHERLRPYFADSGPHQLDLEDMHRAWVYLKWAHRFALGSRKTEGFVNQDATTIHYFSTDAAGNPRPVSVYTYTAKAPSTPAKVKEKREEEEHMINWIGSSRLKSKHKDMLNTEYVAMEAVSNPDEDANDVLVRMIHEQQASSAVNNVVIPPITKEMMKGLLDLISAEVMVRKGTATTPMDQSGDAWRAQNEGVSAAGEEAADTNYWKYQKFLAAGHRDWKPYELCCKELHLDPLAPKLEKDADWTLTPLQVTGAHYMIRQEGPGQVGGGILADECGLGKTMTAFLAVIKAAELLKGDPTAVHRPTLFLTQVGLIDNLLQEYRDRGLSKFLTLHLVYGNNNQTSSTLRKNYLWTTKQLNAYLYNLDETDPANSTTLILSAYPTWVKRVKGTCVSLGKGPATPVRDSVSIHHSDDEDESDDDAAEVADETEANAVVSDKEKARWKTPWARKFTRVIADEGHRLKNSKVKLHYAVACLDLDHVWIVTATPLLNSTPDLLGYLKLIVKEKFFLSRPQFDKDTAPEAVYQSVEERADGDLWVLDPALFVSLIRDGVITSTAAFIALPRIFYRMQLRRTMATELMVNGKVHTAGASIAPYVITTVELEMDAVVQEEHDAYYEDLAYDMTSFAATEAAQLASTDMKDSKGRLNYRNFRRLCHMSFAPCLETVYRYTAKLGATNLAQDIEEWSSGNNNGLLYLFRMVVKDPFIRKMPTDRAFLLTWLSTHSSKLEYLAQIVREEVLERDRKLIVFTAWPMILWLLEIWFFLIGIRYVCVRSSHTSEQRSEAAARFNSKTSGIMVFLSTYATCSTGINLHTSCSRMVLVDPPLNGNQIWQAIGRVHRIGSLLRQQIWILFVDHTINRYVEAKIARKLVGVVVSGGHQVFESVLEGCLPGAESDRLEEFAGGMIMKFFGQSRSRLNDTWENQHILGRPWKTREFDDAFKVPTAPNVSQRVDAETGWLKQAMTDETVPAEAEPTSRKKKAKVAKFTQSSQYADDDDTDGSPTPTPAAGVSIHGKQGSAQGPKSGFALSRTQRSIQEDEEDEENELVDARRRERLRAGIARLSELKAAVPKYPGKVQPGSPVAGGVEDDAASDTTSDAPSDGIENEARLYQAALAAQRDAAGSLGAGWDTPEPPGPSTLTAVAKVRRSGRVAVPPGAYANMEASEDSDDDAEENLEEDRSQNLEPDLELDLGPDLDEDGAASPTQPPAKRHRSAKPQYSKADKQKAERVKKETAAKAKKAPAAKAKNAAKSAAPKRK